MLKWIILSAMFFFWYLAPILFDKMAEHEYNKLSSSIQGAKQAEVMNVEGYRYQTEEEMYDFGAY